MNKEEMAKEYDVLEKEAMKKVSRDKGFWKRVEAMATRNFIHYFAKDFECLTDYHFRFGDIDYWTSGKWYNRKTKQKGISHIVDFIFNLKNNEH